ncbi:MAG: hypothetical protein ACMUJK_11980 [Rhodobacterales bacterium]
MAGTKIATCCYCGTRAALVLRGHDRHELSCSNCGAPLHVMKMLPATKAPAPEPHKRPYTPPHPERQQVARLNRPGFTGGQNSRRIAHYGTDTQQEDLEAVFT